MAKLQSNLLLLALLNIIAFSTTSNTENNLQEKSDTKEKGPPVPVQFFAEKSKHPFNIQIPHRFSLNRAKDASTTQISRSSSPSVPELQVGCGEGHLKTTENRRELRKLDRGKLRRWKRAADEDRKKRSGFYPYPGRVIQAPPVQSYSYYNGPPVYQISRPYVIPIWGVPGKVPVYLPPQPVYTNPGFPHYNPGPGIRQPDRTYLPVPPKDYLPPETNQDGGMAGNVETPSRFGEKDEDDRPVWDMNFIDQPSRPTTQRIPTRRPQRPGTTTSPPLFHRNDTISGSTSGQSSGSSVGSRPNSKVPGISDGNQLFRPAIPEDLFTSRPPVQPTQRPPFTQQEEVPSVIMGGQGERRPVSRCVWAIVSCCSVGSVDISYNCFEQLGCIGAFWGPSPCESEFARAAIAAALNYYN